jgi:hypothetical protein
MVRNSREGGIKIQELRRCYIEGTNSITYKEYVMVNFIET